uniref:MORN repeat-containing protein 5 n=1 Tax=Hanusia phi TaxID=3032 RepID=A0A7S0NCT9_9CRYP
MDLGSLMQTQTQLKMENAKVQPNEVPNMNDLSSDDDEMQKSRKPLAGISEENDDEDDQEEVIDYFVTEDFVSGGISGVHCCCCHGTPAEKLEGAHRINNKDGSSYNGEWVQGKWEGTGRWSHQDSGTYDGMWRDGLFQGSGIFIFPDGDMFEGKFRGGCPIAGLLTKANGLRAKVTFDGKRTIFDKNLKPLKQNVLKVSVNPVILHPPPQKANPRFFCECHSRDSRILDGFHRIQKEDGTRYEGEWKNGQYHGQGFWYSPKLGEYQGEWQNGLIFGRGNFKFPNGKEIMADFEDSCPVAGTIRTKKLASRQRVKFDGKTSVFDPNFWNSLKLSPMMLMEEEQPTDGLLPAKQSSNMWYPNMGSSSESVVRSPRRENEGLLYLQETLSRTSSAEEEPEGWYYGHVGKPPNQQTSATPKPRKSLLKKSGSHAEHMKNRNPNEPRKRAVTFGPGV